MTTMTRARAIPAQKAKTGATQSIVRQPRPLLPIEDLEEVIRQYRMTDHAIERCGERGIGILEVYSAIADPSQVLGGSDGVVKRNATYQRGDIGVVVATDNSIVTVIDHDADFRARPRQPLTPFQTGGPSVAARTKSSSSLALDEAWALIPHTDDEYRKIDVTPQLGRKLLGMNTHNRPIRPGDVAVWKHRFVGGEYARTHQGIAIDSSGVLQDGQNRLTAAVELDIPFSSWVAVGMPPANFDKLDAGRQRSNADVLAILGQGDPFVLGSTVRLTHLYKTNDTSSWSKIKVTPAGVVDIFNGDPERYSAAVRQGRRFASSAVNLTRTAAAAGFYLIARVNSAGPVAEFFEGLITGADVPKGDPRLALARNVSGAKERGKRSDAAEHLALLIKAWNLWAGGKGNVTTLMWRRNEPMPRVLKFGKARNAELVDA